MQSCSYKTEMTVIFYGMHSDNQTSQLNIGKVKQKISYPRHSVVSIIRLNMNRSCVIKNSRFKLKQSRQKLNVNSQKSITISSLASTSKQLAKAHFKGKKRFLLSLAVSSMIKIDHLIIA